MSKIMRPCKTCGYSFLTNDATQENCKWCLETQNNTSITKSVFLTKLDEEVRYFGKNR